jgi:hypothetical protein
VISNKNKHKKGKVCFRTDKKLSEKKRTKPKTNVGVMHEKKSEFMWKDPLSHL